MQSKSQTPKRKTSEGFTLMELLVVVGIMTIISAIMFANHSAFGGSVTLRNLAYDIALSVREMQTYGISVRQAGAGGTFDAGYGVHFDITSPAQYVPFVDLNDNGVFNCEGGSASCELFCSVFSSQACEIEISRGFHIADVCVTPASQSSGELCSDDGVSRVDIVFRRPEPDAHIRYNGSSPAQRAEIVLQSPRGGERSVHIEVTGQISVQ